MNKHTPTEIKLQRKLRQMEVSFARGGASHGAGAATAAAAKSGYR